MKPKRTRSSRMLGTNPRALGTNPRATGRNPRALGTNPGMKSKRDVDELLEAAGNGAGSMVGCNKSGNDSRRDTRGNRHPNHGLPRTWQEPIALIHLAHEELEEELEEKL